MKATKRKKDVLQEVEKTLHALDGVGRLRARPGFYARLQHKSVQDSISLTVPARGFLQRLRPLFLPAALATSLALGFVIGDGLQSYWAGDEAESLAEFYEISPPDIENYLLVAADLD